MSNEVRSAKFAPGTVVRHRRFGYRGLIFDVDAEYSQSDEWYEMMADSRPRRDKPWYHVLVDGESHTTYVAEDNLEDCGLSETFDHPLLSHLFRVEANQVPVTNTGFEARYSVN